jgi:hypothetical protein
MTAVDYEDWLFYQLSDPKLTPPEPWLEEHAIAACVQRDDDPPEPAPAAPPKGDEGWRQDGFFERRIGRIGGGPPPRGKPKPPAPPPLLSDAEMIKRKQETESVHRAMDFSRR